MSEKKFIDVNLALELHEGKLWAWDVCDLKEFLGDVPAADVVEVVHGRWILEAHEEHANYRWNVTSECSECHAEKKEVYAEFILGFHKDVAEQIVLEHAESVKLQNYCPNCGAKMDGKDDEYDTE